jgi:hypothetical protein
MSTLNDRCQAEGETLDDRFGAVGHTLDDRCQALGPTYKATGIEDTPDGPVLHGTLTVPAEIEHVTAEVHFRTPEPPAAQAALNAAASAILGRTVFVNFYERTGEFLINPDGSTSLTFAQLNALAALFETDKIDLRYQEEDMPYSESTPGDSSSFNIEIHASPLAQRFAT